MNKNNYIFVIIKNNPMKHTLLLSLFLIFGILVHAQQKIEVTIEDKTMSKGLHMAVTVIIPESNIKDVDPIWKKYINNRSLGERLDNLGKSVGNIFKNEDNKVDRETLKVEKKGDEWYVRAIDESSISNHKLDVYARASDLPSGCQFMAFFEYTDSVFIDQSNIEEDRLRNMKTFVHNFAVEVYQSVVDDQIKEAKKVLSSEEKTMKKIESNTVKEQKAISRYEVDIQEYEAEIRAVENEIIRTDTILVRKKIDFASIDKDSPAYDVAKDQLKELSKAKSKKFKQIKSYKSKIKSKQGNIKSSNTKIAQNDVKFSLQQSVIEEKEKIIQDLELKKERIE